MVTTSCTFISPPLKFDPENSNQYKVFLAGSIEQDTAQKWQEKLLWDFVEFRDDVIFFNPRREQWDSTWKQDKNEPNFSEQVNWELDHIEAADIVVFYFDPKTKSPISLLELGMCAALGKKTLVYCPEGFWRKGNVDIVCERYGIPVWEKYEDWEGALKTTISINTKEKLPQ